MQKIQIIHVGQADLGVNLQKITRIANRAQSHYEFFIGDQITTLGNPIEDSGVYLAETLLNALISNRSDDSVAITVGITHVSLYDKIMSTADENNQAVLVTTHPTLTEPFLSRVKTNLMQWVLFEAAVQILTIEYRRQTELKVDPQDCELPWHKETRSCIFDYSDEPTDTTKKLISPDVCSACQSKLDDANVRKSVRIACKKIINHALRTPPSVALRSIFGDPIAGLFVGGLIVTASYDWIGMYVEASEMMGLLLIGVLVVLLKELRKSPKF